MRLILKIKNIIPIDFRSFLTNCLMRLRLLLKYGTSDFFEKIEIETTTYCNRLCTYCPNSIFSRGIKKNEKRMDEKLYKKIIQELKELNYSGIVSPHGYGEPLLDDRITGFIQYTKDELPFSKIKLFTNGDFLDYNKYRELADAGVDFFEITQHGEKPNQKIMDILERISTKEKKKISYSVLKEKHEIINRGGILKIKSLNRRRCPVMGLLAINYSGDLLICCNDYNNSIKLGNINNMKLIDIWNSKKFKKIRYELRKGKRPTIICKKCIGT